MSRLFTTREAAQTIGVRRETLQKWIRNGRVKPPKITFQGRRKVRLWSRDDIRKLKTLKAGDDSERQLWQRVRTQVAEQKAERKAQRQEKLASKTLKD